MVLLRLQFEAVGAAATAHGGSKENFQSQDTFLLFIEPNTTSTEEENTLQWGQTKTIPIESSRGEICVNIIKGNSGFYKANVVLGEIYIPLKGLHYGTVEYYHIKTRRKGEVRGLLQLKISDLSPDVTADLEKKNAAKKKPERTSSGKDLKKQMLDVIALKDK